jgi:hypothetical protein
MELINNVDKCSYYELTYGEIFLYRYMETLSYVESIQVETELINNILSVKGGFLIQMSIIRYFDELGESSEYKNWLRKNKLNRICLKLVK